MFRLLVAALVTVLVGFFVMSHFPEVKKNVAARDSLAYWAAGRLLLERHNPYDPDAVLELERQYGYNEQRPLVLRTPPWSLFIVVALGLLSPFWSWLLWMAASLGCMLTGMRLCRRMYGGPLVSENSLSIVGYTFAPVAACLVSGQMGLLLMLGVVLFLWWEKDHPFLSGAALVLPFAKPHLLSLFWFVFFLWLILNGKRSVGRGFLCAVLIAVGIGVSLDPGVFRDYREMLYAASIQREFIPALSGVVSLIFFRQMFWVQFIPMGIGLLWAGWFFLQRLHRWSWPQDGPALLVVSVLTTPYAWLGDETVLLPAMLQAAALAYERRAHMKLRNKVVLAIIAFLNLLLLLILRSRIPFATGIYFWSSLVWFWFYTHARRLSQQSPSCQLERQVSRGVTS
jgi:hypothetical protein